MDHSLRETRPQASGGFRAGSLIHNKRDLSGQLYMRNRYYDPSTGRFTQEDPIGIAGGLNVYGFANGNPAMYDDAFGLSADTIPFADSTAHAFEQQCLESPTCSRVLGNAQRAPGHYIMRRGSCQNVDPSGRRGNGGCTVWETSDPTRGTILIDPATFDLAAEGAGVEFQTIVTVGVHELAHAHALMRGGYCTERCAGTVENQYRREQGYRLVTRWTEPLRRP